ncbi:MAG: acyl-CoA dehydrogenase [Proteobacteria bacterium]|nr:acyl-CoA dehydrogenase [Pseudomonadota bacterium]
MALFNPQNEHREFADAKTRDLMRATIGFFERKGLAKLKADYHRKVWNHDFVDFMREQQALATLMTPAGYGASDSRWDTSRNVAYAEILGFYGIAYWYTFQVSMLGLGPIWMGANEEVKNKTARLLQDGEVFAFGLSEKEHGADIYSSSMTLSPAGEGRYKANGGKYYIGNGQISAITSMFGKVAGSDDYVFFATSSRHPAYRCVKNTVHDQNYVAELALADYPITDADILERGPKAWDNMLNTINLCKFNLGFGSIGLATHALYESLDHAAGRILFGKPVTDFPHVRQMFVDAYARLVAMRVFAYRATDYMRSASAEDRRYLLYNPMVKMKVTTQGEQVVRTLHEVIAAKGFENEPFFEIATHEIGMLPKLEGTAHVNMALVVKFMRAFLFEPQPFAEVPVREDASDDRFLMNQGPTAGLGKVRFHDWRLAYDGCTLPNAVRFREQIDALCTLLTQAGPSEAQARDIDFMLALGECFCLVAYGQLILEGRGRFGVDDALLDQIFDVMVRDMSAHALTIYGKASSTEAQRQLALAILRAPVSDAARFERVWRDGVLPLRGSYRPQA